MDSSPPTPSKKSRFIREIEDLSLPIQLPPIDFDLAKAAAKCRATAKALSASNALIMGASLQIQTIVKESSDAMANPEVKKVFDALVTLHGGIENGRKLVEDGLRSYPVLQERIFTHGEGVEKFDPQSRNRSHSVFTAGLMA
ncbi:hypothetical protein MMC12_008132 [Toensbergia leucococca]|nr:hypothetical protein [Toensbergia leucococca]